MQAINVANFRRPMLVRQILETVSTSRYSSSVLKLATDHQQKQPDGETVDQVEPQKKQATEVFDDKTRSGQTTRSTITPQVNISGKPNTSDQRAKWMAKMSPELHRKPKTPVQVPYANITSKPQTGSVGNSNTKVENQGKGQNWKSPQFEKSTAKEPAGALGESERNSWMQRMHGNQQKKQANWLKDIQAKQEAGRQIQQKKISQHSGSGQKQPNSGPVRILQAKANAEIKDPEPEDTSPEHLAYLGAVEKLNSYQAKEPAAGRMQKIDQDPCIEETRLCMEKTGFNMEELKQIPVIQVAGTKGRGSTCGIVESILRAHGVSTGMLCSPHLFLTRERIRIDGEPLSETDFTHLFWQIQRQLEGSSKPLSYSKLLTVMAFHAFRNAKVEVAIVEVGSACAGDSTNITDHASTIGISSLGWEQCFNQTNSMRDIAWNKAAIMKPNSNVFINVTQPECCEVLAQKAKKLGLKLHRVPSYQDYINANLCLRKSLTDANYSIKLNGSLGIQLAYDYLRKHKPQFVVGFTPNTTQLTQSATRTIECFKQPGKFDIIKCDMFTVYLDIADSLESMVSCREWFNNATRSFRCPKILLFNKVNEFNSKDLLTILRMNVKFEEAFFVPSPKYFEGRPVVNSDDKTVLLNDMEELQRAKRNAGNWRNLCEENGSKDNAQLSLSIAAFFEYLQDKYGKQKYGMRKDLNILVTGSRQLVAATLNLLQKMKNLKS